MHCQCRAYPRSRGGTPVDVQAKPPEWGLSPLARGNLVLMQRHRYALRPIPARAGEPSPSKLMALPGKAYPRSRGGTEPKKREISALPGLSPLARGNPP